MTAKQFPSTEEIAALVMRPHSDRGQGRKPLSPSGELMKPRQIRMLDSEWTDARLVGMSAIRAYVVRQAKKLRAVACLKTTKEPK